VENMQLKLENALQKCRNSIKKTQKLIDYHKSMLKSLEKKEVEILAKIEKYKMKQLCNAIHDSGINIDTLIDSINGSRKELPNEKKSFEKGSI
jgi:uncharacterized protein (DUF342 family)